MISRQQAVDALGEEPEVWSGKDEYEQGLNNQWHYDVTALKAVPSVQPEIKPIDYQNCANAMLRMWMDKVVTDGEYNRIMDKLNAFWRTRNEQPD